MWPFARAHLRTGDLRSDGEEQKKFEDELKELEAIVARIDSGELSLEESIEAFERGIGLVRCSIISSMKSKKRSRCWCATRRENCAVRPIRTRPKTKTTRSSSRPRVAAPALSRRRCRSASGTPSVYDSIDMKAKAATRARLDVEMARRGLAESRERAQRLILAGLVRVNSRPADKPDLKVDAATDIAVLPTREYASRGAYKLLAALDHFALDVTGRHALDVGASTGGFTDVLLRRGVAHVIALDVGYGQLAESLRDDPRVTVMDRTNIRSVTTEGFALSAGPRGCRYQLHLAEAGAACGDRSGRDAGGYHRAGKASIRGRERERRQRRRGQRRCASPPRTCGSAGFAVGIGLEVTGSIESPITGPAGNREFLAVMRWSRS